MSSDVGPLPVHVIESVLTWDSLGFRNSSDVCGTRVCRYQPVILVKKTNTGNILESHCGASLRYVCVCVCVCVSVSVTVIDW